MGAPQERNLGIVVPPSPDGKIIPPRVFIKETIFDDKSYLAPTWDQMGELTYVMARKIIDAEDRFDRVIALAKGGWSWARTLVDYLGMMENLHSARVKSYEDVNVAKEPELLDPLPVGLDLTGERVLILDEVNDTGGTTIAAIEHIKERNPDSFALATHCYKPHSRIPSDYYAFRSDDFGRVDSWVAFPHEVAEFSVSRANEWKRNGHSIDTVTSRLDEIGMIPHQSRFYVGLVWEKLPVEDLSKVFDGVLR